MKWHEIKARTKRLRHRRVGRGLSAGGGKTAGRGTKGQKSRAGYNVPRRFEGGQTPLVQRLPKVGGFTSRSAKYPIVKVEDVNVNFKEGERVSPRTLFEKGLVSFTATKVKLVGPGKLKKFVRLDNIELTRKLKDSLPVPKRPVRKPASPRRKK